MKNEFSFRIMGNSIKKFVATQINWKSPDTEITSRFIFIYTLARMSASNEEHGRLIRGSKLVFLHV